MKESFSPHKNSTGSQFAIEKEYWSNRLAGEVKKMSDFPHDYDNGPDLCRDKRVVVSFSFSGELCERMIRMADDSEHGVYIILITGIQYLLYRYTGDEDIIIGVPQLKGIGAGAGGGKWIVLRNPVNGEMTFKDLLLQVRNALAEADENTRYFPFDEIIKLLKLPGWRKDSFIFDTMLLFENIHEANAILPREVNTLFFFALSRNPVRCTGEINYNAALFGGETIRSAARHLMNFFESVTARPMLKLEDIDILSADEKWKIVFEFNRTQVNFPAHKALNQVVEEQVEKKGGSSTLIFAGNQVTYNELNTRANRLAGMLKKEYGILAGDIAVFQVERSPETVIALLAIIKAKATALPIEPGCPTDRRAFIIKDSGVKVILKGGNSDIDLDLPVKVVDINSNSLNHYDAANLPASRESDSPAYIVYTSGSTGNPKGVLLTHRGILNHIYTKINELELTCRDIFCHNLSISFVASIWQVFTPLFLGARLLIYSKAAVMDFYEFFEKVERDKITILEVVPSLLNSYLELVESGKAMIDLSGIRKLVLTGEAVLPALMNRFFERYRVDLVNAYGQSECSDDTLHYKIPYDTGTTRVPVGKPAGNTRIYILSKNGMIQPVGLTGEIFIAGDGLAPGYLNKPELTAKVFVNSHLDKNGRIYRTGDIGRWLPGGIVEFRGRVDQQVKIRGFRVELGEVENQLLTHKEVNETVVVVIDEVKQGFPEVAEQYLCAYYVPASRESGSREVPGLADYLARGLPDYMIPRYFVSLEKMPLNSNGKIDRKSLPAPDRDTVSGGQAVESPAAADDIQTRLIGIFARVLRLEKDQVSLDTNFFKSGGHSLKAVILISELHKELDTKISLLEIFENPTIRQLSKYIRQAERDKYSSIKPVEKKEYHALSSAQKRLYILQQIDSESKGYNIPMSIILKGKLDREKLEAAFYELIKRHEMLRTSFGSTAGELFQRVRTEVEFTLHYYESSGDEASEDEIIAGFFKPFDLRRAPLLRAGLIKKDNETHIFIVDMHHIITDGASLSIFISDFMSYYSGKPLLPLRLQYKDFSEWQNTIIKKGEIRKQEDYWLREFAGELPSPLAMPFDYERPAVKTYSGEVVMFQFSTATSAAARELADETGTTLFMVLLAAYYILLYKYTNQVDIVVGTPVLGRRHDDLKNIIGMFVNMLPIKSKLLGTRNFLEFLMEIKQKVLSAVENQDYQFEKLVNRLGLQGVSDRNPLFEAVFTLNEIELPAEEITGLNMEPHGYKEKTAKFDILMGGHQSKGIIYMFIEYSTALFKRTTVRKISMHYVEILEQVLANRSVKLDNIRLSSGLVSLKQDRLMEYQDDFGF